MGNRFVVDSTTIISYRSDIFQVEKRVSKESLKILEDAFDWNRETLISIPSIVFLEVFFKFGGNEESARKLYYELLIPFSEKENFEIREMDQEVLSVFSTIDDDIENLEFCDKLVLSSAIVLNAPLISSDGKIEKYVKKTGAIPEFLM